MSRRHRSTAAPMSLFSFQDIITATTGILILLALVLALSVVVQRTSASGAVPIEDTSDLEKQLALLSDAVDQLRLETVGITQKSEIAGTMTPMELKNKVNTLKIGVKFLQSTIRKQIADAEKVEKQIQESGYPSTIKDLKNRIKNTKNGAASAIKELNELKTANRVVYNFRKTTSPPFLVQIERDHFKVARANSKQPARVFGTAFAFIDFAKNVPPSNRYFVLLIKPAGIAKYMLARPYLEQMDAEIGIELLAEDENAVDEKLGSSFK